MNLLGGKRWTSWPRLLAVAGTAVLLWVVFSRIDPATLNDALRRTDVAWCLGAFAIYGMALGIQAYRWHLALRAVLRAVHLMASWRLTMVGHFFFTVFFGMAGGDAAKSALYAKWFRFPLPEVIAAAPLDRGLSLGGALALAVGTWLLAAISGGLNELRQLRFQGPGLWVLSGLVLVAAIGVVAIVWRPQGDTVWARTVRAFREGGGRIALSPRVAAKGLFVATLGHLALSGVFALNLLAVSGTALPWAQLAWTLPAITTISCLPFTVAGAGVREVAAVSLLGIYGVPAADCVAASLLTLIHKLAWAGVGAGVMWRERTRQEKGEARLAPRSVSVVMPVLNEAASLPETIRAIKTNPEVIEILVVDGGSQDASVEVARALGCEVWACPAGRGGQMRLGAARARGDVVMLVHADTWLPPNAAQAALECLRDETVAGGGFWKVFRDPPLLLRGARFKCAVRLLLGRRILGDQVLFMRREVLQAIGGVPDMPLMEEFELCRRLRRVGRLALADATVTTSARRFKKMGIARTYLRMWLVTLRYSMGARPEELRRTYEKD